MMIDFSTKTNIWNIMTNAHPVDASLIKKLRNIENNRNVSVKCWSPP